MMAKSTTTIVTNVNSSRCDPHGQSSHYNKQETRKQQQQQPATQRRSPILLLPPSSILRLQKQWQHNNNNSASSKTCFSSPWNSRRSMMYEDGSFPTEKTSSPFVFVPPRNNPTTTIMVNSNATSTTTTTMSSSTTFTTTTTETITPTTNHFPTATTTTAASSWMVVVDCNNNNQDYYYPTEDDPARIYFRELDRTTTAHPLLQHDVEDEDHNELVIAMEEKNSEDWPILSFSTFDNNAYHPHHDKRLTRRRSRRQQQRQNTKGSSVVRGWITKRKRRTTAGPRFLHTSSSSSRSSKIGGRYNNNNKTFGLVGWHPLHNEEEKDKDDNNNSHNNHVGENKLLYPNKDGGCNKQEQEIFISLPSKKDVHLYSSSSPPPSLSSSLTFQKNQPNAQKQQVVQPNGKDEVVADVDQVVMVMMTTANDDTMVANGDDDGTDVAAATTTTCTEMPFTNNKIFPSKSNVDSSSKRWSSSSENSPKTKSTIVDLDDDTLFDHDDTDDDDDDDDDDVTEKIKNNYNDGEMERKEKKMDHLTTTSSTPAHLTEEMSISQQPWVKKYMSENNKIVEEDGQPKVKDDPIKIPVTLTVPENESWRLQRHDVEQQQQQQNLLFHDLHHEHRTTLSNGYDDDVNDRQARIFQIDKKHSFNLVTELFGGGHLSNPEEEIEFDHCDHDDNDHGDNKFLLQPTETKPSSTGSATPLLSPFSLRITDGILSTTTSAAPVSIQVTPTKLFPSHDHQPRTLSSSKQQRFRLSPSFNEIICKIHTNNSNDKRKKDHHHSGGGEDSCHRRSRTHGGTKSRDNQNSNNYNDVQGDGLAFSSLSQSSSSSNFSDLSSLSSGNTMVKQQQNPAFAGAEAPDSAHGKFSVQLSSCTTGYQHDAATDSLRRSVEKKIGKEEQHQQLRTLMKYPFHDEGSDIIGDEQMSTQIMSTTGKEMLLPTLSAAEQEDPKDAIKVSTTPALASRISKSLFDTKTTTTSSTCSSPETETSCPALRPSQPLPSKCLLLLMDPTRRIFEVIAVCIPRNDSAAVNSTTTVADLLEQIPYRATDYRLKFQEYTGLSQNGQHLLSNTILTRDMIVTSSVLSFTPNDKCMETIKNDGMTKAHQETSKNQATSTATQPTTIGIRPLFPIPSHFSATQMESFGTMLLENPKVWRMIEDLSVLWGVRA